MWGRAKQPAVLSHDISALRPAAWRARALRLVLVLLAIASLAAAAYTARGPETRENTLLPKGTTGVVVLDLSLSINDDDYFAVRRVLRRLVAEDARTGLVVFSDVPYELLPPGTPAKEVLPMLRLLVPPNQGPVVNPWTRAFRAGTRVSGALELARGMLERDGVDNGAVLLVSDLETAPDDVQRLAETVDRFKRSTIDLRAVPLGASSESRLIFEGLLREDAFQPTGSGVEPTLGGGLSGRSLPAALLALGGLLFLVLALHELFAARLALPRPETAT